ncbi:CopG family transcriptional regulator [Aeromicrobium stalagmiti]|uniref:CopG family transcriptional regulator n=1 Tax=Aeromicrobium stalagmiti TaxID=2738988 RepID=UPI0015684DBF|nr:CopG family transcriptional regulator [Aeromicrobium stalagmiti]NRQ48872.1 CopG family transcriptional regulator [Aeromicrobium stalagmiti]
MGMTLRLTDEQNSALEILAKAQGISKNEAAARAIVEQARADVRREEIREATRQAIEEYGPLLDRLAQ